MIHAELLAAIPGLGTGIFSLTKNQLLLLWNSKEQIETLTELQTRKANAALNPDRVEKLALSYTNDPEEAESIKCNFYHQNYKSSY